MKLSRSTWLSILLGVAYGVTLRLLMAVPNLEFSGLVSISFFVIVPIATGFIVIITGDPAQSRRLKYAFFAPWIAVLCFLLTTAILMLEGAVCIGLALHGFLVLSSLGGLAACWLVRRNFPKTGALYCVMALPLLLSPVESKLPVDASVDTVVTSVTIAAPLDIVFNFSSEYPRQRRLRRVVAAVVGTEGALPDSYGMSLQELADRLNAAKEEARQQTVVSR